MADNSVYHKLHIQISHVLCPALCRRLHSLLEQQAFDLQSTDTDTCDLTWNVMPNDLLTLLLLTYDLLHVIRYIIFLILLHICTSHCCHIFRSQVVCKGTAAPLVPKCVQGFQCLRYVVFGQFHRRYKTWSPSLFYTSRPPLEPWGKSGPASESVCWIVSSEVCGCFLSASMLADAPKLWQLK